MLIKPGSLLLLAGCDVGESLFFMAFLGLPFQVSCQHYFTDCLWILSVIIVVPFIISSNHHHRASPLACVVFLKDFILLRKRFRFHGILSPKELIISCLLRYLLTNTVKVQLT